MEREYEDDYRQINYEGYKRKIVQVMSSLRYLVDVYTEKQSINQVNNVLADLKEKMQRGNTNSVLELISIFNDKIRHEDRECSDLDCLMREAASKQVSVLRNHIKLMYRLIMDTVIVMRKDIAQVEQEMHYNRDRISHEIDYFCSKYTPVLPSSNIGLK